MLLRQLFCFAVLLILALFYPCEARTIRVPSTNFPTIQAGLDSLTNGDTVLVAMGRYAESLIAPEFSFVLKGDVIPDTGEYPRPVIDPSLVPGSDSLAALTLPPNSHPVLEDLRIVNGPAMFPRRSSLDAGGIFSQSANPILRRCILDSVHIGLWQEHDQPGVMITLESCLFRYDTATCVSSVWSTIIATDCDFFGTRGYWHLHPGDFSQIVRCRFYRSHVEHFIQAGGRDLVISECVFGPEGPDVFSGLHASHQFRGTINDCVFDRCRGAWPAMYIETEFTNGFRAVRNTFIACSTSSPAVGGMFFGPDNDSDRFPQSGTIVDNTFIACVSGDVRPNDLEIAVYDTTHLSASITRNRFCCADGSARSRPAVKSFGATTTFRENIFEQTGVAMDGDAMTDASWNWWGDITGPYHPARNPDGQGDEVRGNLIFEPWYSDTSFLLDIFERGAPLPKEYSIEAYPNPFNSQVRIRLVVPEVTILRLELFDILGRRVKELWNGPVPYSKTIIADGSDLASGTYILRASETLDNRLLATAKIMLVK